MHRLPSSLRHRSRRSGETSDYFDALFNDHASDLLAYLVRRVEPRQDAADLLAEVFVVVWRRIDDVPPMPEARLWLFGVARRVLGTHRRGERRRSALSARLRSALATDARPTSPSYSDPAVGASLARLSVADRELLLLVAWDDLSPTEAASLMEIEAGTVRVRLHRARARFASLYETESEMRRTETDSGATKHLPDAERGTRKI